MQIMKLKKGAAVDTATYKKLTDPNFLYNCLIYFMKKEKWTKNAILGVLCYVMNEGRPLGFYTYQGCYLNKGTDPNRKNPYAAGYQPVFDNRKWKNWLSVDTVNLLGKYGHKTLGLAGVGILSESDVWANGLNRPKTQTSCTQLIDEADAAGLDCHDPEFLCKKAIELIYIAKADSDWRDPKTFGGTASEYAERILCCIGMCGWKYGQTHGTAYERYYNATAVKNAEKVYNNFIDDDSDDKKEDDKQMKKSNIDYLITNLPAIAKGSTGQIVKMLQKILKDMGYYTGDIDGEAGNYTVQAIKAIQTNWNKKDSKILIDGSFGPQCWTKLLKA